MIDGVFDRLAKWWRNAVDRFELQSQEKFLGPENNFPKFAFLGRKKCLCKKSYQYPNSNSPLFGPIVENCVGSFSRRYCRLQKPWKVGFFKLAVFGPFCHFTHPVWPKNFAEPQIAPLRISWFFGLKLKKYTYCTMPKRQYCLEKLPTRFSTIGPNKGELLFGYW